jgi:biotin synthase-related radical SAM superfamily protein
MKAFGDAPWRKAQTARVLWKKGKVARGDGNGAEGDALINRAMEIRKEVAPDDKRPEEQLTDADWNNIVFYYSR